MFDFLTAIFVCVCVKQEASIYKTFIGIMKNFAVQFLISWNSGAFFLEGGYISSINMAIVLKLENPPVFGLPVTTKPNKQWQQMNLCLGVKLEKTRVFVLPVTCQTQ